MTTVLPFGSNAITTFAYEAFSYTISNPGPYTLTISNTPGLQSGYLTNNGSNVVFATASNALPIGGREVFVITASSGGTTVATSSNTVFIKAGRFQDASGTGFVGSNFTFYKNEPIPPVQLIAPFAIATPTAQPAIPTGLTYTSNASNIYSITGTPFATVPQSNYLIIGRATGTNTGKIISSSIPISVSNERIRLSLTGTPVISGMTIGTAITNRVLTAQFPPYPSGGILRYAWFGLPDGIVATDNTGTPVTSPFSPTDPSSTLILTGTPTLAAANAYKNAGITSNIVSIGAFRTFPSPQITNEQSFVFAFAETVLFEPATVPPLYDGVAITPGSIYFQAQTYFGSTSPIESIVSPDLRSDLSLSALYGSGRVNLIGTPSGGLGTATYTIRATNSNGVFRDLQVPITVAADTISFASPPTPIDVCYTYVLSRPSSLALAGYYPSTVQFQASAASGNAVSFSAPGLAGTGLSLSNVTANTMQIVGIPDTVTALKNVRVTATATGTPATAFRDISLAVLNDVITIADVSASQLSFIQNRAITPIQFTASTLSERPVIAFTSIDLPSNLLLSTTGRLTGTPTDSTSGTFTVSASTGYTSQSKVFSYTLTPDSVVLVETGQQSYALTLGGPLPPATVAGLSYSGTAVSNFVFTSLPITYGMTIGNATGIFGGTLTTSFPPDPVLPSNVTFSVQASAGLLTASLPVELNTSNAPRYQWFTPIGNRLRRTEATLNSWADIATTAYGDDNVQEGPSFTDLSIRPIDVNTLSIVGVTNTNEVVQSPDGSNFTSYYIPEIPWPFYDVPGAPTVSNDLLLNIGPKVVVRVPGTTTLYGTGQTTQTGVNLAAFWKSTDDGVTWSSTFPLLAPPRGGTQWLSNVVGNVDAIAYKSSVLLIGTQADFLLPFPTGGMSGIIRSTDGGVSWTGVPGGFSSWVFSLNVDADRWIAAGSDDYFDGAAYSSPSRTLRYSDDQGASWALVTSGDFNYIGRVVVYGNGVWIAGGEEFVDGIDYYALRTSTDGLVWTSFSLPGTKYPITPVFDPIADEILGDTLTSVLFDGEDYIVVIQRSRNNGSSTSYDRTAYTHPADGSSLSSGWTVVPMPTLDFFDAQGQEDGRPAIRMQGRFPVATGLMQPILNFPNQSGNGPVVVSPTERDFVVYQYVPITPIVFSATGVGQVYYFVVSAELPTGITFDPLTGTLSGTSVVLGTVRFEVLIKDSVGVTQLDISITTLLPRVIRQQTSAGAWTSLVRQYTVVNGAQNSVNNRTVPATYPPLGEFTRPYPPDSVDASGNPNCEICP